MTPAAMAAVTFALVSLLTSAVLAPTARADATSEQLMERGVADLAAGRYGPAAWKFDRVAKRAPENARAHFLAGAALNRLGHSAGALAYLEQARELRSTHPDLAFEIGWSLLHSGRYEEAIRQLQQYERAHPGRGQTSEFIGRAELVLGRLDEAEQSLEEALRRDADLAPTVHLALAVLEGERNQTAAAARHLAAFMRARPDDLLTKNLRDRGHQHAGISEAGKPWEISFALGGGHDTNVIAQGDSIPLAAGIRDKSDGFGRFMASGSYTWRPEQFTVTATYGFQADLFESVSDANLIDHYFDLHVMRPVAENIGLALRVSNEYTLLATDSFRNQLRLRPALYYRFRSWAIGELAYAFEIDDYFFKPTLPARDRDGEVHSILPMLHLKHPELPIEGAIGSVHSWKDAQGSDWDYERHGIVVRLQAVLPYMVTASVMYLHLWDDYDNRNTFSGLTKHRDDESDRLWLHAERPLGGPAPDGMRIYVDYRFRNRESDVGFFDYHQHISGMGVAWDF